MNGYEPWASHSCDQGSVNNCSGRTRPSNSLTVTLPAHKFQRLFFNLKDVINLLIPIEQLNILGYLYFFIENFNNTML